MTHDYGRAKNRTRKTLSMPNDLVQAIQKEADEKYNGDFTRAALEGLAVKYPQARKFLRHNLTAKFNYKKSR